MCLPCSQYPRVVCRFLPICFPFFQVKCFELYKEQYFDLLPDTLPACKEAAAWPSRTLVPTRTTTGAPGAATAQLCTAARASMEEGQRDEEREPVTACQVKAVAVTSWEEAQGLLEHACSNRQALLTNDASPVVGWMCFQRACFQQREERLGHPL